MLINMSFGFMVLIASLIELPITKTPMWQKHKIHLANFDKPLCVLFLRSDFIHHKPLMIEE